MKRSKLPNNAEWDKIVDEAFSSTEKHSFSENYLLKKDALKRRGITMKNNKELTERIFTGVCAAAVLAVVAVPTSVVIKNRMNSNGHEAASNENGIVAETDPTTEPASSGLAEIIDESSTTNNELHKNIKLNWLPENIVNAAILDGGVAPEECENKAGMYVSPDREREICAYPYYVDKDVDINDYGIRFTADKKEYDIDGKHVIETYSDTFGKNENFNRRVWVSFDGTQFAVQFLISDNITDDEIRKVIENIELIDDSERNIGVLSNEETTADMEKRYFESGHKFYPENFYKKDDVNIIGMNETSNSTHDVAQDVVGSFDFTIENAYITDTFDGLTSDCLGAPYDFSPYTNEDGKITDLTVDYYSHVKQPNGFYSWEFDHKVTAKLKLLVVDAKITNVSENAGEYCIDHQLMMTNEDRIVPVSENDFDDGLHDMQCYTSIYKDLFGERSRAFSLNIENEDDHYNGEGLILKNEVYLEPNETANVRMAYIVRESEIGDLYLRAQAFKEKVSSQEIESYNYYDLCGIK